MLWPNEWLIVRVDVINGRHKWITPNDTTGEAIAIETNSHHVARSRKLVTTEGYDPAILILFSIQLLIIISFTFPGISSLRGISSFPVTRSAGTRSLFSVCCLTSVAREVKGHRRQMVA